MFDLRIRKARILDGTGNPWFRGDVGIEQGRITAVGDLGGIAAKRELHADDRYLAPGFIDIHTHSDFSLPLFPRGESRISQGVTTEVGGNCGLSPSPVSTERLELLRQSTSFLAAGLSFEWRSTADFVAYLETLPFSHNLLLLAGHGTIRLSVMGFDRRPPTEGELDAMRSAVAEAMEAGAVGLSSGLIYAPGSFADAEELVALCDVVRRYGGIYTTHLRNEASGLLDAVEEALTVGREAGVPLQLSHHKAVGEPNWGMVQQSLARVEAARRDGQDVTLDQYPYTGSSTTFTAFFPEWAMEGGVSALLERLSQSDVRQRIIPDVEQKNIYGWDKVVVASVRKAEHRRYEGMNLSEIGKLENKSAVEAGLDLLQAEEGPFSIIRFGISETDLEYVLRNPLVMVGSDGYSFAPAMGSKPHPRSYGTFARVLGRYVREKPILSVEDAVRKMTSLPAQRAGLRDRGVIRGGQIADLVLFDADQIADTATYTEPHRYAAGIEWVMVGGQMVWQDGKDTGVVAGQVLRASSLAGRGS